MHRIIFRGKNKKMQGVLIRSDLSALRVLDYLIRENLELHYHEFIKPVGGLKDCFVIHCE